jgi:hypothetical protein
MSALANTFKVALHNQDLTISHFKLHKMIKCGTLNMFSNYEIELLFKTFNTEVLKEEWVYV